MSFCGEHNVPKRHPREVQMYLDTVKNFQLARELHKVNLEHDPLPDTVSDRRYRQMQMQQPDKPPGLAIKGPMYSSAIGWKGYTGHGANRCTKMKVFRPTTGNGRQIIDECNRPCSVNSFDKKWRFIRQNKVTPIDLAICWDKTPVNSEDEPKRTKHIDGSNGSQAPAVFSMVHTPKEADDENERNEPGSGRNMPAIFTNVRGIDNVQEHRPKTTPHTYQREPHPHRTHSAANLNDDNRIHSRKTHHMSTPNVSSSSKCSKGCCQKVFNTRLCVACELRQLPCKEAPKEEYKMAFKAGVPNNTRSNSSSSSVVKVPKQKDPYSRRNYNINSLAPPFCLQKDKREDYPEHWRLASVYQHSYKPIFMRKKPLLQSVYQ